MDLIPGRSVVGGPLEWEKFDGVPAGGEKVELVREKFDGVPAGGEKVKLVRVLGN